MTWRTERGLELLAEAERSFEQLKSGVADTHSIGPLRSRARSAMDWLEDTDDFDRAHKFLDEVGLFVRTDFPNECRLTKEGNQYFDECSISLAHVRVGFSVAFAIREAECSVCHGDALTCEHISGEIYAGEQAHRVITRADFFEVSLVSRPEQPDARITKQSVSRADVTNAIGFEPATDLEILCDRCLTGCAGITDRFRGMEPNEALDN